MTISRRVAAAALIDDLLNSCPKLAEIFNEHGMACVGCAFSRFHTVADAAWIYQLDESLLADELSRHWASMCTLLTEEAGG